MARFESIVLSVGCAVVPAGCASSPPREPAPIAVANVPPAAASQEPVAVFRCEAEVRVLGDSVVGEARRDGDGDLQPEAWDRACEAMRTQHGLDCEDDRRVLRVSTTQQIRIVDGNMSKYVRIELRAVTGRLRGEASDADHEKACGMAIDRACEQAPDVRECHSQALGCEPDRAEGKLWRCSPDLLPNVPAPSLFDANPTGKDAI